MSEPCARNFPPSIAAHLRKMKGQRGAGARVAEWLTERGAEAGCGNIDAVERWIAEQFRVSQMTAYRWRTGLLPTARHLEEMRGRWGLGFVLHAFGDLVDRGERGRMLDDLAAMESAVASLRAALTMGERLQVRALAAVRHDMAARLGRLVAWAWGMVADRLDGGVR